MLRQRVVGLQREMGFWLAAAFLKPSQKAKLSISVWLLVFGGTS